MDYQAVHQRAREVALSNGHDFHVVAYLRRGNSYFFEANSFAGSPKFRRYRFGEERYHIHAEMAILRWAYPGEIIHVMRFTKDGEVTMARPCEVCQQFLRNHGIRQVRYTDWNGNWKKMRLQEEG